MSTSDHAAWKPCAQPNSHTSPASIQVEWGARADEQIEGQGRPEAVTAPQHHSSRGPSRRTQIVFASFALAMTGAMAVLAIDAPRQAGGFPLTNITPLEDQPADGDHLLLANQADLDRNRWSGIVVHHLGEPFGTAESVHRQHLSWDYQGLGYHFLIGNGNGLSDGEVHVGYRWIEQFPGAHVVGDAGTEHNARSIGICLIGNGDRQPFTDRQIKHLTRLVQRLQQELGLGPEQVHLHRHLTDRVTSPGRLFPEAQFRASLLDPPA